MLHQETGLGYCVYMTTRLQLIHVLNVARPADDLFLRHVNPSAQLLQPCSVSSLSDLAIENTVQKLPLNDYGRDQHTCLCGLSPLPRQHGCCLPQHRSCWPGSMSHQQGPRPIAGVHRGPCIRLSPTC